MSNRSSASPRPQSPSTILPTTSQPTTISRHSPSLPPSMIQVARPNPASSSSLATPPPHQATYSTRHTSRYPSYSAESPSSSPRTRPPVPPPEVMRAFEQERGLKRPREGDKSGDEEERPASASDSEIEGNFEQVLLPAPKKRTRTLMTPDQLTALHRLLSITRFPTTEQREQCGREIGLSARRVQVWFQNQRQKSKAQQQAAAQAGSSRGHPLAPRSSGPYQVFSYEPSRYDPPSRPYSSSYPYAYDELHRTLPPATMPLRPSRFGYHRRGASSSSYSLSGPTPRDRPFMSYPPAHYPMEGVEPALPTLHYRGRSSELGRSQSPEASRGPIRDDTLPPIWPENNPEVESQSMLESSSPGSSSRPRSHRPVLLPTGLPPPQPLEPTPLWSHPHTNPRYMRPPPPGFGLPSLLGSLTRGRARSDPHVFSRPSSPQGSSRPGEDVAPSTTETMPPGAREDTPGGQERTRSDPGYQAGRRPSS